VSDLAVAADNARQWTERRNEAMRQARSDGMSLRAIAAQVGMSVEGVRKITG
jgi:hypothetical protein